MSGVWECVLSDGELLSMSIHHCGTLPCFSAHGLGLFLSTMEEENAFHPLVFLSTLNKPEKKLRWANLLKQLHAQRNQNNYCEAGFTLVALRVLPWALNARRVRR